MTSSESVPTRLLVGDLPDIGQVLVTMWPSGEAEIAWRPDDFDTWSRPQPLEDWPTK